MVLEQINTDENKENISVNELRDAVKPGGFLDSENKDYQENIKSVWDLLNNSNQLSEIDKALIDSLKSVLKDEIQKIKSGNIVTAEDKNLLKVYIDLLWENDQEVQELEELIALYNNDTNEESTDVSQQDEIIITNFGNLSEQDKNLLNKLSIWSDLINDIDWFLDKWDIDLSSLDTIKAVNTLNDIIKEDSERHEKLKNIVKIQTMEISHAVNIKIAKNDWKVWDSTKQERVTVWNIDYYSAEQKMLVQLRANVCYWENLEIDWCRWNKKEKLWEMLFSFDQKTENQKITSIYIYRLEIITRQDIIDYRNDTNTHNLLSVPELDDLLNVLPREEQNKILEDFLGNCFFDVRWWWMHFEHLIWSENFRALIELAIKAQTEKDISIEQWIQDRQSLIESLRAGKNDKIIQNIEEEIRILNAIDPISKEHIFKTMWDYYKYQYDNLKSDINKQNTNNVDIEQRQYVQKEISDVLIKYERLISSSDLLESGILTENSYKWELIMMIDKLANLYNDKNPKYKQWIESWEFIDPYIINNIVAKYKLRFGPEQEWCINRWWKNFTNYMDNCYKEISNDINSCSDILDIVYLVSLLEGWEKYELKKTERNTTRTLKLWTLTFVWWSWLEYVRNQVQNGEIKVVITKWYVMPEPWKHTYVELWELCKYEERDWKILLRKYNRNWELPSEPTQIITPQDVSRANLAMSTAMESINTEDMETVIKEFDERDTTSFTSIQKSIEEFIEKYNKKDFSSEDKNIFKQEVWKMYKKITKDIPKDKIKDLRETLSKMWWNKNWVENPYEQYISARIDQIDVLLSICEENGEYSQYLSSILNLEPNNTFRERADPEKLYKILTIVGTFLIWLAMAPFTWWMSLLGSIALWATIWAGMAAASYIDIQNMRTNRNIRYASDKKVEVDGEIIIIPWHLDDKDKTNLYKRLTGEMSPEDFRRETSAELLKEMVMGALVWGVSSGVWKVIGDTFKIASNFKGTLLESLIWDSYNFFENVVWIFITTNLAKETRDLTTSSGANTILADVESCLESLVPKSIQEGWNKTLLTNVIWNLSCKKLDTNGNLVIEYDPDDTNFHDLLDWYRRDGATVRMNEDWTINIIFDSKKTITYVPSKVPMSYRLLPQSIKNAIANIWWVSVNDKTWNIAYAYPKWLDWLRSLWAYLENMWLWNVFIGPEWYTRLIFAQSEWQRSVITINPEET